LGVKEKATKHAGIKKESSRTLEDGKKKKESQTATENRRLRSQQGKCRKRKKKNFPDLESGLALSLKVSTDKLQPRALE